MKKQPVSRLGGLTLLPTLIAVGVGIALYLGSPLLLVCVLSVVAAVLLMIYDDCIDVGIVKRPPLRIRSRLTLLAGVALVSGYALYNLLPAYLTFLPFAPFEVVFVGVLLVPLFALWCIFWQLSSVIDGIDGLSGSVFLVLFAGTTALSLLQGNNEAFILSVLGVGALIPWLYINYAPAKAYLTESGITLLIFLFAIISFLLGIGDPGHGIWAGCLFGAVLIASWCSNILQLLYRKKTGGKLFRIAPIHHHFEAMGIPSSAVVLRYTLVSFICVVAGLSVIVSILM